MGSRTPDLRVTRIVVPAITVLIRSIPARRTAVRAHPTSSVRHCLGHEPCHGKAPQAARRVSCGKPARQCRVFRPGSNAEPTHCACAGTAFACRPVTCVVSSPGCRPLPDGDAVAARRRGPVGTPAWTISAVPAASAPAAWSFPERPGAPAAAPGPPTAPPLRDSARGHRQAPDRVSEAPNRSGVRVRGARGRSPRSPAAHRDRPGRASAQAPAGDAATLDTKLTIAAHHARRLDLPKSTYRLTAAAG